MPNPQVGAVVVHRGRIIGEGWHAVYGGPHAEVQALDSVRSPEQLSESTLYVSLEPCCHDGKTPPCTKRILQHRIPRVVIGCTDPNPDVAGRGAGQLQEAGVEVEFAEDPRPFEELITPFRVNLQEQRPYIVLKWAQTRDGFMGHTDGRLMISGPRARRYGHRLRSRMPAIMIGKRTALMDDPLLTLRHFPGQHPIRIVWDRREDLPTSLRLFWPGTPVIVLTESNVRKVGHIEYHQPSGGLDDLRGVMQYLYQRRKIGGLLVEGGPTLLNLFMETQLYDELHVLQSTGIKGGTVRAPEIPQDRQYRITSLDTDMVWQWYRFPSGQD